MKVCDFNTRFLELYNQLDFDDKSSISVIDYENALRPRGRIYERVVTADVYNLEDAFNIWIENNNRNQRNFRNSPINIVTQGIQNNNLNKSTKPRQNTHNYYRFGIENNNNNNLNISNDNNISYYCRNRKILKPDLKISSTNNNNIKDNNIKVNNNNDKDYNNINNVNENIINNNSINSIINNSISNLATNNNNNNK
ncbi:hypothetical protein H8356DRAFT_1635172 [Neocallimastix lanati (nom. inval.)]|nr:hypothetical protein H8356DRAFT_1635172 [Neocallimastix sp. JGI-2020a]